MKLDTASFRGAVKKSPRKLYEVARHIGLTPESMSFKMRTPEKIKVGVFLKICDFINANPDRFIASGDGTPENAAPQARCGMKLDTNVFREAVQARKQIEVGRHIGLTKAAMSFKMKTPETIKIEDFLKICDFLKVNPDIFFIEE